MNKYEFAQLTVNILKCKKCEQLCSISPYGYPHIYLGDFKKDIMIIGQNPGQEHDYPMDLTVEMFLKNYKKNFFICNIFNFLTDKIFKDEIIWERIFFTNIVKHPSPKLRAITNEEINKCSEYLKFQIEAVRPKYIITLGAASFNGFSLHILNKRTFKLELNKIHRCDDFIWLPLYHPNYLSLNPDIQAITSEKVKELLCL